MMAGNAKRKGLKDVLGLLQDKDKTSTDSSIKVPKDDITGLEHKIPIVSEGIINFEDDSDAEDIEIPIPEGFSLNTNSNDKTDSDIEIEIKAPVKDKEVKKEETISTFMSSMPSDNMLNKMELMEQKLLLLQEENKKQYAIIKSQKAELEEYTERLGKAESDNKKLKGELSNADSNARMNLESQLNRAAIIEEKYDKLAKIHEEMKAKVRRDIRKIRMREKELGNKLEMMRNDSETLLTAKDKKILQLKQQIDNLEFEIETLKEKAENLQELARENEEKAERVVKALRLSTSLLETSKKE
jgi:chromosome segregation ATPase